MPLSSPTPGYARPSNSFSNPVSGNLLDPAAAIATWADYDAAIDTLAKKAARGDIAQTLSNAEKVQALANIGGIGLAVGAVTSVASASTVDLGAQATFRVLITGTTAITSFGTVADQYRQVRFSGALTLTHNATTLILPGGANITTAAGDVALCTSDGSGNWRVVMYQRADGTGLDGVRVNVAQSLTGAQLKQAADNLALADLLGPNAIINGEFRFWQRGTSSASAGYQTADRWFNSLVGGTVTMSQQAFGLGDVMGSGITPRFFLRQTVSGQSAAGDLAQIVQRIEDARSFSGQQVTVSFWARRSSGTGNISLELEQHFGTGGSPSAAVQHNMGQVTLTGSWARYTATVTLTSVSARTFGSNNDSFLAFNIWTSAGSTWNSRTGSLGIQTIGVDIWGVMLHRGATALEYIQRPLSVEEMLCRRYLQDVNVSIRFQAAGAGSWGACQVNFSPLMRATPTTSTTNGGRNLVGSVAVSGLSSRAVRYDLSSSGAGDCYVVDEILRCTAEL